MDWLANTECQRGRVIKPSQQRKFLYYLTEYIPGPTLGQLLKERTRLSVVDARNIITQVAAGLRAFHRKDTLHQDIKPDNILYTHAGVKIIDFGSAYIAGINEIDTGVERNLQLGTAIIAHRSIFWVMPPHRAVTSFPWQYFIISC